MNSSSFAKALGPNLAEDRLDARGFLFRQAGNADVTFDFFDGSIRDLVPRLEPPPELSVAERATDTAAEYQPLEQVPLLQLIVAVGGVVSTWIS